MRFISVFFLMMLGGNVLAEPVVHVYNWSDYISKNTLAEFEKKSGIKVVYDVYDSNETLEAKLLAGHSGYDVIFPSATPFAKRHIKASLLQKLDLSQLPNRHHIDPLMLKALQEVDPGNQHVMPYMWGLTGIGYNIDKIKQLLGTNASTNSWSLLFDPNNAAKLAQCGIAVLDDEEVLAAGLFYLGKQPNSMDKQDLAAAQKLFTDIRKHIRYFHSSKYINDLANGDLCLVVGYSGDVLQAKNRAIEAKNNQHIGFTIPKEGAIMAIDVIAIPKDAPHVTAAHAFINYLMEPKVIAEITNEVNYANANKDATALIKPEVRDNPNIYPSDEVKSRLRTVADYKQADQRTRTRLWTRIKTGK